MKFKGYNRVGRYRADAADHFGCSRHSNRGRLRKHPQDARRISPCRRCVGTGDAYAGWQTRRTANGRKQSGTPAERCGCTTTKSPTLSNWFRRWRGGTDGPAPTMPNVRRGRGSPRPAATATTPTRPDAHAASGPALRPTATSAGEMPMRAFAAITTCSGTRKKGRQTKMRADPRTYVEPISPDKILTIDEIGHVLDALRPL